MSEASNKPKTAANRPSSTPGQPRSPQNAQSRAPQAQGRQARNPAGEPQAKAGLDGQPARNSRGDPRSKAGSDPVRGQTPGSGARVGQREPRPRLTPEEQAARAAERAFRNPLPTITFPEDLPVLSLIHI